MEFLKETIDKYGATMLQTVPIEDQAPTDVTETSKVEIQSSGSDNDFVVINSKSPQSPHNELVELDNNKEHPIESSDNTNIVVHEKEEIKSASPKEVEVVHKKSDSVKRVTTRRSNSRESKTTTDSQVEDVLSHSKINSNGLSKIGSKILVPGECIVGKVDDSDLSVTNDSLNTSKVELVPEKELRVEPVKKIATRRSVIKSEPKITEQVITKDAKEPESPKDESPKKLIEVKIPESESESDSDIERDFTEKIPGKGRIKKVIKVEPETKVARKVPVQAEPEPQVPTQGKKTIRRIVRAKKQ
jgi:hypothetical protein